MELRAGRLRDYGSIPSRSKRSFCSLGIMQHPMQQVVRALSLVIKHRKLEPDHSPPSSAKVKNVWN
jgi:hypothetical protein